MRQIESHILDHFTAKECIPIFYGYSGSLAHGTYLSGISSNINLFVVLQYPKQYYYGLGKIELKDSGKYIQTINDIVYDVEYFEITTFLKLMLDNSPNVINYLFINKEDRIIWNSKLWNYIENNYTEFVSQKYVKALLCWSKNLLEDFNKTNNYKDLANSYQYMKMANEYVNDLKINTNRSGIDASKIKEIKQGIVKTTIPIKGLDVIEEMKWIKHIVNFKIKKIIEHSQVNRTEIEKHLNIILWTLQDQEVCNKQMEEFNDYLWDLNTQIKNGEYE